LHQITTTSTVLYEVALNSNNMITDVGPSMRKKHTQQFA